MPVKSASHYWAECDGNCGLQAIHDESIAYRSQEQATAAAINLGWKQQNGRILCPDCHRTEAEDTTKETPNA